MKNWYKLIALILAAAMCVCLLAACGSSSAETETAEAETEEPAQEETETAEEPAESAEEETEAEEPVEETAEPAEQEITEIEWYCLFFTDDVASDKVEAAINEITEPEIGVHVNMHCIGMGNWMTQVPMEMSAGTQIDLIQLAPMGSMSYSVMQSSGQLMEIGGLLQEYAPDAMELMSDYMAAYTYEGGIYGIPTYRIYTSNYYMTMRQDILQELGIEDQALAITTWSEYENILQTVTDAYTAQGETMWGTIKGVSSAIVHMDGAYSVVDDNFSSAMSYDFLGDSLSVIACDAEGHVTNLYASEYYQNECRMTTDWYNKGLVYTDSPYMVDQSGDYIKDGVIFALSLQTEFGSDINGAVGNYGYPMDYVKVSSAPISTSTLTNWGAAVPITAKEPEAACKFLNLLYTRADILNLFVYGIEGDEYVVTDGIKYYADGVDAFNVDYAGSDWMWGNQFLVLPRDGQTSDFRERAMEANNASEISSFLGVAVDTSSLSEIIAGISSVTTEYRQTLESGMFTDDAYAEFLDKLEAAGVEEYIAAYQDAVDAYLAQ